MSYAPSIRLRISMLLFGQYFGVGAWFVSLGVYLSKTLHFDGIIGAAYGMFGIATITSTLFVGVLADRLFAAQKVLGVLLLCAGTALAGLSTVTQSPTLFLAGLLCHCLFSAASVPLGVSIALSNLPHPERQFPGVRVWGSIGWIVAGLVVGLWPGAQATQLPMQLAAATYCLTGLYAFTLPNTPPRAKGQPLNVAGLFGLDLVKGNRDRSMWIFITCVMLVAIPKKFYDSLLNTFMVEKGVALHYGSLVLESTGVQTLGQIVEALTLLTLSYLIGKIGIKWVMVIGMAAWVLRFLMFAFGFEGSHAITWLVLLGICMHGLSYDFFFVSGQLWLDQRFDPSMRTRAQTFYWFILNGVGVVIGANVAGVTFQAFSGVAGDRDWTTIWLVPALITFVVMLVFLRVFRETPTPVPAGEPARAH